MLKKYKNGVATVRCPECAKNYDTTISEFTWDNIMNTGYLPAESNCPRCEIEGKTVTTFLNPNISEGEYDEFELEATGMIPTAELNERKYLRDMIWDKRPDLKNQSRALINSNGKDIVDWVLEKHKDTELLNRGPYAQN